MPDSFNLPVLYKGKELSFPARLLLMGYTYKLELEIASHTIIFERDDERNWRALAAENNAKIKTDIELLRAIADAIVNILKW